MLKYAIPLMFVTSFAFAQAQPNQPQTGVNQPAPAANQAPQAQQAPTQTGPVNAAHVNARNAAIQQIEQALQQLRQSNQ